VCAIEGHNFYGPQMKKLRTEVRVISVFKNNNKEKFLTAFKMADCLLEGIFYIVLTKGQPISNTAIVIMPITIFMGTPTLKKSENR